MPEETAYYVAYTSYSRGGPLVSLARTRDFHTFERLGAIFPPEDKDAALLPRRINGDVGDDPSAQWTRRPRISGSRTRLTCTTGTVIGIMLEARQGGWWDANKVGLSIAADRDA